MEFRLTYEGVLLGASRNNTRARHKHEIRKIFHKQLQQLFHAHPAFEYYRIADQTEPYDNVLTEFTRFGYKFFPLARRSLSLLCSVSILFLRPDLPGGAIRSGDIDNRMKTIFDALRLPSNQEELERYTIPAEVEEPFFCLLEDDSMISHAALETDTLLQPVGDSGQANDARLVVTVRLSPYRVTFSNIGFS